MRRKTFEVDELEKWVRWDLIGAFFVLVVIIGIMVGYYVATTPDYTNQTEFTNDILKGEVEVGDRAVVAALDSHENPGYGWEIQLHDRVYLIGGAEHEISPGEVFEFEVLTIDYLWISDSYILQWTLIE